MAYEPGGGSGEPYSKAEDLMYTPGFSIQDYIRHMMAQGRAGAAEPMGTNIPDFAQDRMYGRTPPSDLDLQQYQRPQEDQLPPADGPYGGMDPQQLIQMLLAGRGR